MAIALVASCQASSNTNHAVTSDAMDTSGADLIIIAVAAYLKTSGTLPTDSKSNTWTALTLAGNPYADSQLFYCLSPTVGSGHTFSYGESASYPWIAAAAYSGVASYDQESGNSSTGTSTIQPGSITPAADGALLLTQCTKLDTDTYTSVGSGFTIRQSYDGGISDTSIAIADLIQGTAAAVNPTWTLSGNATLSAVMAAFLASGGGGGPVLPALLEGSMLMGGFQSLGGGY